jgi:hypothetical protein
MLFLYSTIIYAIIVLQRKFIAHTQVLLEPNFQVGVSTANAGIAG